MNLYIAIPSYTPGYAGGIAVANALQRHPDWRVNFYESSMSLLTFNFNSAWADALNLRETIGLDWFLLMHADIRPMGNDWLERLIREAQTFQADVLSAIIPIKSQEGWTSTAIDTDPWRPRRVTLTEAFEKLPPTWTNKDLLVNTGLMLVDFRKPWVEKICFTVRDKITYKGKWTAEVESEDWNFSRQCKALDVKLFATRVVRLDHYGVGAYPNYLKWGEKYDGEWQQGNGKLTVAQYE